MVVLRGYNAHMGKDLRTAAGPARIVKAVSLGAIWVPFSPL